MFSLSEALDGYLECAVWTTDPDDVSESANISDISQEDQAKACDTIHDFYMSNKSSIGQFMALGYNSGQVGHDFYLTRNRHGAGFWDRGAGEVGDRLTESSHGYGSSELTQDDFGNWHFT